MYSARWGSGRQFQDRLGDRLGDWFQHWLRRPPMRWRKLQLKRKIGFRRRGTGRHVPERIGVQCRLYRRGQLVACSHGWGRRWLRLRFKRRFRFRFRFKRRFRLRFKRRFRLRGRLWRRRRKHRCRGQGLRRQGWRRRWRCGQRQCRRRWRCWCLWHARQQRGGLRLVVLLQRLAGVEDLLAAATAHPAIGDAQLVGHHPKLGAARGAAGQQAHGARF